MSGYRSVPVIVRPSDLRARTVPADVAQAVRDGRAKFVGFEGQGDPASLLAARERTLRTFEAGGETVLAHRQPRPRGRGVGVTGPSRRGA